MEKHYKIKVNSIYRFFIILLPVSLGLIFLWIYFSSKISLENAYWIYLPVVISFIIAYYFSRGLVQITISENGIKQVWLKHYIFNKEDPIFLLWKHIDSFEYRPEKTFDFYYINLKNRSRLKFTRFNIGWYNDDLKKLKNELPVIIEKSKIK